MAHLLGQVLGKQQQLQLEDNDEEEEEEEVTEETDEEEDEDDDDDDEEKCGFCKKVPKEALFQCGHGVCMNCSELLKLCYNCRKKVKKVLKL